MIFQTAAVTLQRVSPIMFGDKLSERARRSEARLAVSFHLQPIPFPGITPTVFNPFAVTLMTHRQGDIVLVVEPACNRGNRVPRHDLLEKHDAATPAVVALAADVEAEIHL